jgi:hypothetical protein
MRRRTCHARSARGTGFPGEGGIQVLGIGVTGETAKSWMSAEVSVRVMVAVSPMAISAKTRLRIRPSRSSLACLSCGLPW